VAVLVNNNELNMDLAYEGMDPESQVDELIELRRTGGDYEASITLAFRSQECGDDTVSELSLSATFLAACSTVGWAGALRDEQWFIVNTDTVNSVLEIKVHNPEAPERFWDDNDRLMNIYLLYRRTGDVQWSRARDEELEYVDFKDFESSFGYATLKWNVGVVADGLYDLRVESTCFPLGLDPPEGVNSASSPILHGILDRSAPRQFSQLPEPSDGTYSAGDEISVRFTEDILCARPFRFLADMVVGTNIILNKNDVDILCQNNKLELSLFNTMTAAVLSGKKVTVRISEIQDLAHNTLPGVVDWTFKYQENFDADATIPSQEVEVREVELNTTWDVDFADTTSLAYSTLVAGLQAEVAAILDVDASRLSLTGVSESASGKTLATVTMVASRRRRSLDEGVALEDTPLHLAYILQTRLRQGFANNSTVYPYLSQAHLQGTQELQLDIVWAQLYPPLPPLPTRAVLSEHAEHASAQAPGQETNINLLLQVATLVGIVALFLQRHQAKL
jgi:hypothetical protein